jgi:hypothetical protein
MPAGRRSDRRASWALAAIVAAAVFLPWTGGAFVADDWAVLLRASSAMITDIPTWFTQLHGGWYRPASEVYFATAWHLFGTEASAYRCMAIGAFVLTAILVCAVARSITGSPGAGLAAGVVFATLAPHAEAVLWIAAFNELLAGLGAVLGVLGCLRFVRSGSRRALLAAWGGAALAVTAKETALGLPLVLIACGAAASAWGDAEGSDRRPLLDRLARTDPAGLFDPAGTRRGLVAAAPVALASAVIVLGRMAAGLPYDVGIGALALARNLVYDALMLLAAVPPSLHDLVRGPLGRLDPLPVAAIALSTGGLLTLAGTCLPRQRAADRRATALGILAVVIILAGIAPVAPIVTERTLYLPSVGVALGIAALARAAWVKGGLRRRRIVSGALCVFVFANTSVVVQRATYWRQSADANAHVTAMVVRTAAQSPHTPAIWLVGLPDRIRSAYAFRNAFPPAAELLGIPVPVRAVLDAEIGSGAALDGLHEAQRRGDALVLRYADGRLRPDAPRPAP